MKKLSKQTAAKMIAKETYDSLIRIMNDFEKYYQIEEGTTGSFFEVEKMAHELLVKKFNKSGGKK